MADLLAAALRVFFSEVARLLDAARVEPREPYPCLCFFFPEEDATVVLSL